MKFYVIAALFGAAQAESVYELEKQTKASGNKEAEADEKKWMHLDEEIRADHVRHLEHKQDRI